ncbi:MAG TPA: L,D-transpeptidase family protein [Thermoanaerobaculia bacterium]|jgi:hypothetical protein
MDTGRSPRRRSAAALLGVALLVAAIGLAGPVPFWGARESDPAGTDPETLRPGHFVWDASIAPDGPVVVVVSLSEQRADVYRNGVRVGVTTVSTGKPGHLTPTGIFTILNKDKDHRSKTYNDAPMPYSERLTWDGVALHAGGLPGYPESHGCVHLPTRFAQLLFGITHVGMTVVIASDRTAPHEVAHPAFLSPVAVATGTPLPEEVLAAGGSSCSAEAWRSAARGSRSRTRRPRSVRRPSCGRLRRLPSSRPRRRRPGRRRGPDPLRRRCGGWRSPFPDRRARRRTSLIRSGSISRRAS